MAHLEFILTAVTVALVLAWFLGRIVFTSRTARDLVWRTALVVVALTPALSFVRSTCLSWQLVLAVLPGEPAGVGEVKRVSPASRPPVVKRAPAPVDAIEPIPAVRFSPPPVPPDIAEIVAADFSPASMSDARAASAPAVAGENATEMLPGTGNLSWPLLLASAWLIGTLLQIVGIARAAWKAHRLIASSMAVNEPELINLNAWSARRVGLSRPANLLMSLHVGVPVVSGMRRPAIIVPPALTAADAHPQLRAALLHEYGHVRRHDVAFDLLLRMVVAAFWPHPLVYLMAREIGRLREEICDNFVLAEESPVVYSELLLRLSVALRLADGVLIGLGMFTRKSRLEARIDALLAPGRSIETVPQRLTCRLLFAGTSIALLAAVVLRLEHVAVALPPGTETAPVASASDAADPPERAMPIGKRSGAIKSPPASAPGPAESTKHKVIAAPTAPREFRFQIVTKDGRPVAGATVALQGLGIGTAYFDVEDKHLPIATSDATGAATVVLNEEVHAIATGVLKQFGKDRVGRVSLKVEHPNHPLWWRTMDVGKERNIMLADPITVRVRAHRVGEKAPATHLYPMLSMNVTPDWEEGDGLLTIRRVDLSGDSPSYGLRIVQVPANGVVWFSEEIELKHIAGNPIDLDVELREGVRLRGALGEMVPRPVRNGRVSAFAIDESPRGLGNGKRPPWSAIGAIADDGTFVLESLPATARHLQIVATCDGWVSRSPTKAEVKAYAAAQGFPTDESPDPNAGMVIAQLHPLDEDKPSAPVIAMEPTAGCEVTVLDPQGKPVPNAIIQFFPNRLFHGYGSYLLGDGYDQIAFIREMLASGDRKAIPKRTPNAGEYAATTNADGVALVTNLPASGDESEAFRLASFVIQREGYVAESNYPMADVNDFPVPILAATLTRGKTERMTVTMRPDPGSLPGGKPAENEGAAPPAVAKNELSGRVVNEQGEPLEGVEVLVFNQDCFNIRTDKEGMFHHTFAEDFLADEPANPFTPPELVARDRLAVRFVKPGYAPQMIVLRTGARQHGITLQNRTFFEGFVRLPDGTPAKNVLVRGQQEFRSVELYEFVDDTWTETHTDERGHYRLLVQLGAYVISAGYPAEFVAWFPKRQMAKDESERRPNAGISARSEQPRIAIFQNEVKKVDFDLERSVDVQVRFVDSRTGRPVPKVYLGQSEYPELGGESDEHGLVTMRSLPPGDITFSIHARGYLRGWSDGAAPRWKEAVRRQRPDGSATPMVSIHDGILFDLQPGMPAVTIVLEPPVTMSGRVVDPEGRPVAGAIVRLVHPLSNASSDQEEFRERTETKEDGRFEIRLPPGDGRPYSLMAHDGALHRRDPTTRYEENRFDRYEWRTWANGVGSMMETNAGQQIDDIELRLSRPGKIRGRLVDMAGKPLARTPVYSVAVDNREGPYHHPIGRSDGDGRFEIRFVRPGRHQILGGRPDGRMATTAAPAAAPSVVVHAGETTDAGDVATGPAISPP